MTDCSKHRIRIREDGVGMELTNPDGDILLFTQDVSIETLVEIVARDKEKR